MKSTCRNTKSTQICRSDPQASFPIAMAYVPWQSFHKLYNFHEGLSREPFSRNWINHSVEEEEAVHESV